MNAAILLLFMVAGGVMPTVPSLPPKKKPAGIVCECGRKIPFSWANKLIEGDNGDVFEVSCYGCGAVWQVSQERAPNGKPGEPERRIPIELVVDGNGIVEQVLYRGKPAVEGKDFTFTKA